MDSIFTRQVLLLTLANLKSRYRKTFAGFLWVVMNPIVMYVVQSIVFRYFLKLSIDNYFLFLGSALIPWIFVNQSLDMTTTIFQSQGALIKSFATNPLVYLFAQLLDNFVNFLAGLAIVLTPLVVLHEVSWLGVIMLPIPLVFLVITVISLSWILATLQVFLRDTKFVLSFVLSVAYFATPIFYPIEYVPEAFRWGIHFNPFYIMLSPIRAALYQFELGHFLLLTLKSAGLAILSALGASYFWRKKKNEIIFRI